MVSLFVRYRFLFCNTGLGTHRGSFRPRIDAGRDPPGTHYSTPCASRLESRNPSACSRVSSCKLFAISPRGFHIVVKLRSNTLRVYSYISRDILERQARRSAGFSQRRRLVEFRQLLSRRTGLKFWRLFEKLRATIRREKQRRI